MKTIKVKRLYCEPQSLYNKANTKTQRALLGYMTKAGYARDPIYGGAFYLIKEIEKCSGIYILETEERPNVTMEIVNIAESAMLGMWDEFAFSKKEVNIISEQLGNIHNKITERK